MEIFIYKISAKRTFELVCFYNKAHGFKSVTEALADYCKHASEDARYFFASNSEVFKLNLCSTCGEKVNKIVDECEVCRLERLLQDAIDNHGWTEEDAERFRLGTMRGRNK